MINLPLSSSHETPTGSEDDVTNRPPTTATAQNARPVDGRTEVQPNDVAHLQSMINTLPSSLTDDERQRVVALLMEFKDSFSKNEYDIGRTKLIQHSIDTGDSRPVREQLRRHPQAYLEFIDAEVDKLLALGIIEPSASPWASNLVLVRKKDGKLRLCVDYRRLNALTIKDAYPIPRIDACLDCLGNSGFYSQMDQRSGYWQCELSDGPTRDRTAFICRKGQFRFCVMPFGLCNAVSLFQRLQDKILAGLNWFTCLVYLDDIVVFSQTFDEHIDRLRAVMERMRNAGLKFNLQPG